MRQEMMGFGDAVTSAEPYANNLHLYCNISAICTYIALPTNTQNTFKLSLTKVTKMQGVARLDTDNNINHQR